MNKLMVQIADEMRPSPMVIYGLTLLSKIIPTWKLIPTQDVIDVAFKEPHVRKQVCINKNIDLNYFYF